MDWSFYPLIPLHFWIGNIINKNNGRKYQNKTWFWNGWNNSRHVSIFFRDFKGCQIQPPQWIRSIMQTYNGCAHLYSQKNMLYLQNLFPFGLFMRVVRDASNFKQMFVLWTICLAPESKAEKGRMRTDWYKRDGVGRTQRRDSEGWARREEGCIWDIHGHQTLYS